MRNATSSDEFSDNRQNSVTTEPGTVSVPSKQTRGFPSGTDLPTMIPRTGTQAQMVAATEPNDERDEKKGDAMQQEAPRVSDTREIAVPQSPPISALTPAEEKKIVDSIKVILEKSFLVTSLAFAFAVAYTSYELTNKDKTGDSTEIVGSDILSAAANFFMAATFGKKFLDYLTGLPKKSRAYVIASLIAFFPSLLTVLAAYKLNVDSLSGLGFSEAEKGMLEAPNLFYSATTRFLSVVDALFKRIYCNFVHLYRRYMSSKRATYQVYYDLLDALRIHKYDLAMVVGDRKNLNQFVTQLVQHAIDNQISFGRSRSQLALYLTKQFAALFAVAVVLYVVPVLFSMLTAAGLNALSQVDFFQKSMGWFAPKTGPWGDSTALVLTGMIPTAALYFVSAIDAPDNTEDLLRTFASGFGKFLSSPVMKFLLALIVTGGLAGLMTLTGRGLEGEDAKLLSGISNATNATNTTVSPFVKFGPVANDFFFDNPVFMAFFNMMQAIIAHTTATMLAAGTLANGRGFALWILGCVAKMGEALTVFSFWKGMLSYNLGFCNAPSKPNEIRIAGLIDKLDSALVSGKLCDIQSAVNEDLDAREEAEVVDRTLSIEKVGDTQVALSRNAVSEELVKWKADTRERAGNGWCLSGLCARFGWGAKQHSTDLDQLEAGLVVENSRQATM